MSTPTVWVLMKDSETLQFTFDRDEYPHINTNEHHDRTQKQFGEREQAICNVIENQSGYTWADVASWNDSYE